MFGTHLLIVDGYAVDGSRAGDAITLVPGSLDPKLSGVGLDLGGARDRETLTLTPAANPFAPDGVYRPQRPTSASDPKDPFLPAAGGDGRLTFRTTLEADGRVCLEYRSTFLE